MIFGMQPARDVADKSPPRWLTLFGVAAFTISVVIDAAFTSRRWSMLDLQIYRWAGQVTRHSGDLYNLRFPHYQLGFTYTPMAALIFAVISPVALSALKWLIAVGSIASLVATAWLTWGALGYRRQAGRVGLTLATAGLAMWLEPVQQVFWFGQVNVVLMFIVMADLLLPDSRRFKGVGIGLAAGFKLTALIFVPYLLLTRRFLAAGVALATFALTIVGSLILLPDQSRRFWFGGLFASPRWIGNVAFVGNQSLRGALIRLLGSQSASQPYWVACALVVGIGGLLLAAWAARRGSEPLGVVTCAMTGLLISPVSWAHHWVWVVPGLVVAIDLMAGTRARADAGARAGAGRWRWAGWPWLALAALAAPFFVLPQALVPAAMVQGNGVAGPAQLTGDLYVLVGLVALCLVARAVVSGTQSGQPASLADNPRFSSPVP
jgi:Glycosyltransferase family 87